jgi:hypothetical protein
LFWGLLPEISILRMPGLIADLVLMDFYSGIFIDVRGFYFRKNILFAIKRLYSSMLVYFAILFFFEEFLFCK